MHALDPLEADVRRRRRAGDEDDRPALPRARLEAGDQLRHRLDDLVGPHDADVEVGHEADRPAPLPRAAVERDRARVGAGGGAGRQRPVERVELGRAQVVVLDQLDARGTKGRRQVWRDDDARRSLRTK